MTQQIALAFETVEIPATSSHKYSVIWLHGLGADGHDFENIVPELHLIDSTSVHFIFPHAPIQKITINHGAEMRAWYDILSMNELNREVDFAGIERSAKLIDQLIQKEINSGIPSKNILLVGFSQGGVLALHTGLRFNQPLAGIIALSAYLPTLDSLKTQRSEANNHTPIFMAHGIIDSVVAIEMGKAAFDGLKTMGYSIQWHDYVMEHSLCVEEIEHIAGFVNTVFK
ncbi:MAG: carboxylesterase [Methylococcales bacterium]|nr:carboxylesterase [Methylococcales bacterium]